MPRVFMKNPFQLSKMLILALLWVYILGALDTAYTFDMPSPLLVDHNLKKQSVSPHLFYFVDRTGYAGIDDVFGSHAALFSPLIKQRGDPSFGYSRDVHWFRIMVKNPGIDPVDWTLEFSYPHVDYLELYVPDEDGFYNKIKAGDHLPFEAREVHYRNFAFPLTEKPGERIYFLRVESSGSITIPLIAWSSDAFLQNMSKENLLMGIGYGILLAMAIYHIFIFFSIREKSYLYLTFFIVSACLFSMTNTGIAYQFLWPKSPYWGNLVYPLLLAMTIFTAFTFARAFLSTRARFPLLDMLLVAAIVISGLLMPLSFFVEYYHMIRATALLTIVGGSVLILVGVVSLARGYRESRYYILACVAVFLGAMLSAVRAYGFLPENFLTNWSNLIGMVAMALLFSFGVADKINSIRLERGKAVRDLAKLNERLVGEKEQLAVILRSIGDAVIATNSLGRVILMNYAAERLTGKLQEEVIGVEAAALLNLPKESLPRGRNSPEATNPGCPEDLVMTEQPLTLTRDDGVECVVEIAGAPLRFSGEAEPGMVFAVRDITAKTKLENEAQKARKIESLGLLAGGIAHDFNNLLTAIIGNLSLIRVMVDGNNHKCFKALDRIEQAAQQAGNLTRQLLTFSRGGAPVKRRASINDLVVETIDFLLSGSAVRARVDIQKDLWPVNVDADQIAQVINNLVINAIQAMPEGGELCISAVNIENPSRLPLPGGFYVRVTFTDQGVGIPSCHLGRIFDPYFSSKADGTGLGLSICYSIVKKHEGYITVDSVEGAGSSFHVYLPATDGEVIQKQRKPLVTKVRKGRILVMDDDEQVLNVAEGMLNHLGFDVICADDGIAALEKYRQAKDDRVPFSAVIMDLTVPGGTGGLEGVRLLLKFDPSAIVLVSSGYSDDMVMANYREYGFSGVVAKPYTIQELCSVLDEVLNTEDQKISLHGTV